MLLGALTWLGVFERVSTVLGDPECYMLLNNLEGLKCRLGFKVCSMIKLVLTVFKHLGML